MLNDAALLTVKVAGAEAAGLYDLKMENAAIIRKAARDLMCSSIHSICLALNMLNIIRL